MTHLDHILASLRSAGHYNRHDLARPTVILWTDGESLWKRVAARIAESRAGFFQLEPRGIQEHMGPSTWLRYQLGKWEGDEIPVVYLPGISRAAFRSPHGFPAMARHLFALQFLGQFWNQLNGKDWTPAALLSSREGGLGLDLARDAATVQALETQLAMILDTPVSNFKGKRLEAADFNGLAVADAPGMLLRWMADPQEAAEGWPSERWTAFREVCQQQYGFDPAAEGKLGAAEKLVAGGGVWDGVWDRLEEAPVTYRGVRETLALVQPTDLFGSSSPRLPQTNQLAEDQLRNELLALAGQPQQNALATLKTLARTHRPRAVSLWSHLGETPLAIAAGHLGRLASQIESGVAGSNWPGLATAYLAGGWHIDAEARQAFASVRTKPDQDAVAAALRATYLPWLETLAERTETWADHYPNRSKSSTRQLPIEPGTVCLFVDGLRADVALQLSDLLGAVGLTTETAVDWAPLPSVTATAKPGWAPLTSELDGDVLSENFAPHRKDNSKSLTTEAFRKLISHLGLPWFSGAETGDPTGSGWTETADFDSRGHEEGAKLAWRIDEELCGVRQRVVELLQTGWKQVMILTDHGWLWMPGGLSKTEIPAHLTESKWGRCAVPQPGAKHDLRVVPWFWDNQHHVVLAPGATAFRKGMEYSHGGMTLQETLSLMLCVRDARAASAIEAKIASFKWLGLRLNVEIESPANELSLDLRTKAADPTTSILSASGEGYPLKERGKISLLVENDQYEGTSATLVVLHQGQVIAKHPVTVGEN